MKCLLILGTIERGERGLQTTQQMAIIKLKILQLFMLEMLSLSHTETKTSAVNCLWLPSNNNINNVDHSTRLTVLCCV